MDDRSFLLRRAIARPADWQMRYPALTYATTNATADERPKEIVVAAANASRIRMVFFSSLGSILDVQVSWKELANAQRWFQFALRWSRWWLPEQQSLTAIIAAAGSPADSRVLKLPLGDTFTRDEPFCEYLDIVEAFYRRNLPTALALATWDVDSVHREEINLPGQP
ncbi:hypothetical protein [Caballeronia sp. 15711]|uniref:hypothetical protein n=1 Tax=Caballeronia sp. 15711 TaxID=3391029 RepID=UPI0039E3FB1B